MRIADLAFPHPAALYRTGDASVAVIRRHDASGPTWAQVVGAGAGLDAGYIHLRYHSGDTAVSSVDADASDEAPVEPHADPRLTDLGEYVEVDDVDVARRDAISLAARLQAQNAAVDARSFTVASRLDGRVWQVRVGPTHSGQTSLTLRDAAGTVRHVDTRAARETLERAKREAVTIEGVELVARGRFDPRVGRRPRLLRLTLEPADTRA